MPTAFPSSGYGSERPVPGGRGAMERVPGQGAAGNVGLAIDNMLRNEPAGSATRVTRNRLRKGCSRLYYQDLPQTVGDQPGGGGTCRFQQSCPLPPDDGRRRQLPSSDAEFNIANGDVEKALQDPPPTR